MMQSRTHNCGELRLSDAGKSVTIVGWLENVREVGANFAFCVLRDFYGTTQVVIENEEMMKLIKPINKESTISVTGTVRVTVLYTPENESGVRALEFAMPFSAQGEGLAGCAHVVVETEIELLESRMLNPRKIFTRCKLVTHLAGCRKVCLTISSDAETDPALLVEKRCCGQTVSLLRQVAEKDLTFSETMSLSLGREGAAELLHCRANGIVTETKAIGNKLIFKGVFLVSALYRTIGGQLASASAELPFSQIMETDSTEENTQVSMRLRITGTDIQIDGSDDEGRQLSVTVYYHTMAFLRETREVTLLTDLYSTAYETRYEPSQLDLCSLYESVTRRQTVREVLEIGVAAEAVLSLCADCGAVSVSLEGEITQLRTAVTVRALYLDEDIDIEAEAAKAEAARLAAQAEEAAGADAPDGSADDGESGEAAEEEDGGDD